MMLRIKQRYMHKADFEKKVHEIMQELRFQPSDEVWKRVDKGISERTRRPFAFLWVAAAVLLITGSGYYGYNILTSHLKSSSNKSNNKSIQPGQAIANKRSVAEKKAASET